MNNLNWTANIRSLSYEALLGQVKNKGALMSNSVEFTFDDETQRGSIIVGIVRKVGEFEVVTPVA